jgi:epoxyqueuosine reductase
LTIDRDGLLAAALGLGFQRAGIAAAPGGAGGAFLVTALSCHRAEPDDLSIPGEPHGLIAPFARRHFYREAVLRLQRLAARIREQTGAGKAGLRIHCNSSLPEKPLAAAAGLGFYGKHSLVIAPGLGSQFIIAALALPFPLGPDRPPPEWGERGRMCGACQACRQACPVGAIVEPGVVDPARCLQGLAGRALDLAEPVRRAWGTRLYGCQDCQDACPFNRNLVLESPTALGELGPSLPLRRVLAAAPGELRRLFRGTAMGLSWIEPAALLRNALLAAGNRGDPAIRPAVEPLLGHADPLLRGTARWAWMRL